MTIDPTLLRVLLIIIGGLFTVSLALVGFIGKNWVVSLKDLASSVKDLNATIVSIKEWVVTDFVTKEDHEKAYSELKERIETKIKLHKAECR